MYCWGNTINGELGLGGIEENYILSPEEIVNFESVNNIKSGNYLSCMRHQQQSKYFIHVFTFSGLWK